MNFSAKEFFSAQVAHIPDALYTNLKLLNISSSIRRVTLTLISETGENLSAPVSVDILPGKALEQDISEIFGIRAPAVGSLRVVADGEGIVGDVILGDPISFSFAAALSLQTQGFTEAVFSQVVNLAGFFTGLAVFNPGVEGTDARITVFSDRGAKTGEASFRLEGGRRLSKTLSELVPSTAGQVGGYTLIRSTRPLIAQQLFGDGVNLLSAVPPTILQ